VIPSLVDRTPVLSKDASGNTVVRELPQRMLDVEFYRDIRPILQRSCVPCHTRTGSPPQGLALDDATIVEGYENTYHRLANDQQARYGIPPVISNRTWRQSNASRYVRMFQSRRSLLMWKIMGRRLDGWTNADHPTESQPGNVATLPAGANANDADIDFTGTQMPPPGSGIPPLTDDEKMTIARWIDLGCPVSSQDAELSKGGWFADELKPTLHVQSPRAGGNTQALSVIRIGMYDSYSGLDRSSLSVIANFGVNGKSAGMELGRDFQETGPFVWTLPVNPPLTNLANALLTVRVKDIRGNWSVAERSFSMNGVVPPPPPPDTTPPNVSIAAPAEGATVQGQITITASASDNVGVAGVQLLMNGQPLGGEVNAAPYSMNWNSTTAANGNYIIAATARDAAGNRTTSAAVRITVQNQATPPPLSGLVAAYSFDEGTGSTLNDSSGRGNHGAIRGAQWTAAGRYCGALSFNGSSDWVTVADQGSLELTGPFTISAWVKPASVSTLAPVAVKERAGGISYGIYSSEGRLINGLSRAPSAIATVNRTESAATSVSALPVNAWSHLAATFNGGFLSLYVNGALARSRPARGWLAGGAGPLRIGANAVLGQFFQGVVDELRVYSRELSESELQADIRRTVGSGCLTAADAEPPQVSITAPAADAPVTGTVLIQVQASDAFGIRDVQFFLNGQPLGQPDRNPPYSFGWNTTNLAPGTHLLSAVARDTAGNSGSSVAVRVRK